MKLLTVIVWFLKKLGYKYSITLEKGDSLIILSSEDMKIDPNKPLIIKDGGNVGIGT